MRVVVTGASGFVGGWVARLCCEWGHEVYSFGRRLEAEITQPPPRYRRWDITHPLESREFRGVDAVVHCAAHVGQWGSRDRYHTVNVTGTRNVLTAFNDAKRFVFISTSSVYKQTRSGEPISESDQLHTNTGTAYARTKAEGERIFMEARGRTVVLRPHIVYGPGDTILLPRILKARRAGVLLVPGDGENRTSITNIKNLVEAVRCAITNPSASGAYNVSDAETPTIKALLSRTFDQLHLPTRLIFVPRPLAWGAAAANEAASRLLKREPLLTRYAVSNLADSHILNIGRARTHLGYEPLYSLEHWFT